MRTFYIVLPALSLLNMGVNGAIIANTLSSRRDGNTVGSGPYSFRGASRQVRQLHSADFRSDTGTETESSHDTPSGVVSRQTSRDLTVANAGGDPSENSALRGLQPTMRFARGGSLENTVAETSKELPGKLAAHLDNLGLRSAFDDESCKGDTKDARELIDNAGGSGTDIGLASGHEDTARELTISVGKVTSAVRRAPTVANDLGSATDAVPAASSAAVAQGTQTLLDFATFDDVRTTSSESRKVAKRRVTGADVATFVTAIDNAVATGNAAEARRSLVVGYESRALPGLPSPVDTTSLPVSSLPVPSLPVVPSLPTGVADAIPVKRRFRRQDDASNDAAADSDAAVEVDTTTNSAADTEAADAASDDTSDDGASLDELE